MKKIVACVNELSNIRMIVVNDFGVMKFVRCHHVLVLTELIVSKKPIVDELLSFQDNLSFVFMVR